MGDIALGVGIGLVIVVVFNALMIRFMLKNSWWPSPSPPPPLRRHDKERAEGTSVDGG